MISLAMLKLEKNFIGHIDKGYPRKPYEEYPLFGADELNLRAFVDREKNELDEALDKVDDELLCNAFPDKEIIMEALKEIADVQNTLDYLFEGLLKVFQGPREVNVT